MLVAKTDLSSILKTHMEEGKNQFSLSSDFSAHTVAHVSSTQTDTQINKVQWKKKKKVMRWGTSRSVKRKAEVGMT